MILGKQHRVTSTQARKGVLMGHLELSVECPQCHSAIGRRCFLPPGFMGITHLSRRHAYQRERMKATVQLLAAQAELADE